MRILSGHLTPLDRQTTESINIVEAGKTPGRSLNLKTEWGGAKIPGILVSQPKGVSKTKSVENRTSVELHQEGSKMNSKKSKGIKRITYNGDDRSQYKDEQEEQEQQEEDTEEQGIRPDGGNIKRSRRIPPPSPRILKMKKSSPSPKKEEKEKAVPPPSS